MKAAQEWVKALNFCCEDEEEAKVIRAIQADALRYAAKICQDEGDIYEGYGAAFYLARDRISGQATLLENIP